VSVNTLANLKVKVIIQLKPRSEDLI